jgi:hypothetical protein
MSLTMCVVHGFAIRKITLEAPQQTQQQQQQHFVLFHPNEFLMLRRYKLDEPSARTHTAPAPDLEGILAASSHSRLMLRTI